ncbi:hypothetical protein KCP75_02520 [Salmonella enterica subsp. enterica]|nr:hypothetical protein KCP75_02520 [Salmonella enterica subsp. enterica]
MAWQIPAWRRRLASFPLNSRATGCRIYGNRYAGALSGKLVVNIVELNLALMRQAGTQSEMNDEPCVPDPIAC